MKYRICILFILICSTPVLFAQKTNNNWYFGNKAGISFNSGAPVALTDGQLSSGGGVATMSDVNGNLLFYTDGITIWNRNHAVMQNGTGLLGDNQAAQGVIILPQPNNSNIYYVYTVPAWVTPGFAKLSYYSTIDMQLDNGLGAVTLKNGYRADLVWESIAATYKANCQDIWIMHHFNFMPIYEMMEITTMGPQTRAIQAYRPMDMTGTDRYGCLRFSSESRKLCYVLGGSATGETVILSDYDNVNGNVLVVGNLAAGGEIPNAYSAEFSADNTKLYITGKDGDFIYQYDLSLTTFAAIKASRVNIANGAGMKCGLLRGPDGKIYVSRDGQGYLGVINNPNQAGTACGYVNDGVYLNGRTCNKALPNYIYQEYPNPQLGPDQSICTGGNLVLDASLGSGYTYLWQDGSTSNQFTATRPGEYWVEVTKNGCRKRDTINITNTPLTMDLGVDTMVCNPPDLLLDTKIYGPGVTYTWQDGSNQPTYRVTVIGKYWAEVLNGGCRASDTIEVTSEPMPVVNLGKDTSICMGTTLILDAPSSGAFTQYTWQNGSTQNTYTVTAPGTYSVNVTVPCGTVSDTIVVQFRNCNCYIHVPNAFSPNYDFHNNTFKPAIGQCQFATYNMKIFNRWGQKIYETYDPSTGWDGLYKGNLCDNGAYIYVVSYRFNNEAETKVLRGTLMLIR